MTLTDRQPAERPHRERAPLAEAGPWSFGFRPDIEGLRAVAVLGVVLYHAGVGAFRGGYVGVDVFFVVSGFLITGLLWQELRGTGRLSLASFYARRARRLLPASMLVLAATVVARPTGSPRSAPSTWPRAGWPPPPTSPTTGSPGCAPTTSRPTPTPRRCSTTGRSAWRSSSTSSGRRSSSSPPSVGGGRRRPSPAPSRSSPWWARPRWPCRCG